MTRRHKTLEGLIERANTNQRQYATNGKWSVAVHRYVDRNDKPGEIRKNWVINHHGTTVLEIEELVTSSGLAPNAGGFDTTWNTKLTYFYGQSKSDADGLNAVCDYFGLSDRWTFRPVNGGFVKL